MDKEVHTCLLCTLKGNGIQLLYLAGLGHKDQRRKEEDRIAVQNCRSSLLLPVTHIIPFISPLKPPITGRRQHKNALIRSSKIPGKTVPPRKKDERRWKPSGVIVHKTNTVILFPFA